MYIKKIRDSNKVLDQLKSQDSGELIEAIRFSKKYGAFVTNELLVRKIDSKFWGLYYKRPPFYRKLREERNQKLCEDFLDDIIQKLKEYESGRQNGIW